MSTPDRQVSLAIGVPVRNQLPFVKACLASLERHAPGVPIVIVDDASDPACRDYLAEYAASQPAVDLIRHQTQRGFPYGCNDILYGTDASTICLLNSDTLVSPGWYATILDAMSRSTTYGLAGPTTSFTHTEQQLTPLRDSRMDQDIESVERIAALVRAWFPRQTRVVDTLGGFCLFVRRDVVDRVGCFDERFGLGCGEEDDYVWRAVQAGFEPLWVRDAYVHHFGHCSFTAEPGLDSRALWERNRVLVQLKRVARLGCIAHDPPSRN